METKHTPTPWHINEDKPHTIMAPFWTGHTHRNAENSSIPDYYADIIQVLEGQPTSRYSLEQSKANAEFIVRACALHDKLVEVLEIARAQLSQTKVALYDAPEWYRRVPEIRQLELTEDSCIEALKLAKGE